MDDMVFEQILVLWSNIKNNDKHTGHTGHTGHTETNRGT